QAAWARESGAELTVDFLFGCFIIFIRDSELSHRVFANVCPDAFHLLGHPFGKKLFSQHNLIYMFGKDHKDLRRRITPNFTLSALSTYAAIQQRVILAQLRRWLDQSAATCEAMPIWVPCRDMDLETSQTVFMGSYLTEKERERFAKDYALLGRAPCLRGCASRVAVVPAAYATASSRVVASVAALGAAALALIADCPELLVVVCVVGVNVVEDAVWAVVLGRFVAVAPRFCSGIASRADVGV
ncbi:cytochrome P450 710A11-like, partial [Aegilops tauschii subsp. strangulata]|uniref:cytochrome P450 710A11-like n=1 Tax=Aegilops tauschii subsp. strangulata TaxID=200361 RepID=UPI003CC84ABA